MTNFASLVLTGTFVLGKLWGERTDGRLIGELIAGAHKDSITVALFYTLHQRYPEDMAEVEADAFIQSRYSMLVEPFRNFISRELRVIGRDLSKEHFLEMSKPHSAGTVAEIATKYNISKSEVRRLKAVNQLDAFINMKEALKV